MDIHDYLHQLPVLGEVMQHPDHIDIKTVHSDHATLRDMIAGMVNYQPRWITVLLGIRWGFVRLLGMKQEGIPASPHIDPEDLVLEPGSKIDFFETAAAQENCYWISQFDDSHLIGYFALVADPNDPHCFYGVTIVKYHNWTGRVYFNVIRPFHHLVVYFALKSAGRSSL
jgi:hypothetical protein